MKIQRAVQAAEAIALVARQHGIESLTVEDDGGGTGTYVVTLDSSTSTRPTTLHAEIEVRVSQHTLNAVEYRKYGGKIKSHPRTGT